MGSFNLACVVTNTPIMDGERCVAVRVKPIEQRYGRGDLGDAIQSAHFICAAPVRGVYADYGNVDTDAGNTVGDADDDMGEYMLFHEYAFDAMRDAVFAERAREKAWSDEYYAKNGVPDYVLSRQKSEADTLQALEDAQSKDALSETDAAILEFKVNSGIFDLIHAPEGENPYAIFWREVMRLTPTPKVTFENFKNDVDWLFHARHTFSFHFRPSLYAGQEIDSAGLLKMAEATVKHLQQYEDEGDE